MSANRKAEIASIEIDNPFFSADHAESIANPKKICVLVNTRESAIVSLSVRGFLSPHQEAAASRFRRSFEIMQGMHGKKGFHEHVDMRHASSISEDVLNAGQDLKDCRKLLGMRCYALVVEVCGNGKALSDMFHVKRERLTAADNLRASLDDMACMFGYMHRKRVDIGNHLGA